jgi:hypothetical protein
MGLSRFLALKKVQKKKKGKKIRQFVFSIVGIRKIVTLCSSAPIPPFDVFLQFFL